MDRLTVYRLLWHHNKLSEKRHPAFEQGVAAKVMMWIGAGFMALYMIIIGGALGKVAAADDNPALLLLFMPALMLLDFFLRFIASQTPLIFVKPYLLMPMKTERVVEAFLLNQVGSSYNFLWLCLLVPYALVAMMGGVSVGAALVMVITGLLIVCINSQWYLMARTLILRSLLWWLLILAVWALLLSPFVLPIIFSDDPVGVLLSYSYFFEEAPMLCLLALVLFLVLCGLLLFNRWMQLRFIRQELSRPQRQSAALKHVSQFTFLERFGLTGEYLKLELKSIMRNKAIRGRVVMSLGLMVMFSSLITFTEIYDQKFFLNFWCFYCFAIYGATTLTKVMGPEGNYIDLLMTQRENILMLLRAKYFFHVAILLVPFLIMLPAVISGKFSLLMMLAYLLITSGMVYILLFQLAVYNKQTLPLNQKMTGKNNMESGFQLLFELTAMFLPIVFVMLLMLFLSDTVAYIVMSVVGLALTLTFPMWLRNIYHRMMSRKYVNMEGFHASRG